MDQIRRVMSYLGSRDSIKVEGSEVKENSDDGNVSAGSPETDLNLTTLAESAENNDKSWYGYCTFDKISKLLTLIRKDRIGQNFVKMTLLMDGLLLTCKQETCIMDALKILYIQSLRT